MNLKLEQLTNELEETICSSCDIDKIFNISSEIDNEIAKTFKQRTSKKDIEKLLNTNQKKIIVPNIKKDLLDHYHNISLIELEILSQNIYDYCCLITNNISVQEIIWYITEKNTQYYDQLTEKDKSSMLIEFNIKLYKQLINKYIKTLKSNKQS